jgi:hypothetical protein
MFFTVCSSAFGPKNEKLVRFVLNPEIAGLLPKYRFFTYYNLGGRLRFSGPVGLLDVHKGTSSFIAENILSSVRIRDDT